MEQEQNILLIRCFNCQALVSTSIHIVGDLTQINCFLFSAVYASLSSEVVMSSSPFDKYCTYHRVFCKACGCLLGKYYKALTENLSKFFQTYLIDKTVVKTERGQITRLRNYNITTQEESISFEEISSTIDLRVEIEKYNPLYRELTPYDEFQIMRRTLSFADKSSTRFTSMLLRLEERMAKLEVRCDELSRTIKLFKEVVYKKN